MNTNNRKPQFKQPYNTTTSNSSTYKSSSSSSSSSSSNNNAKRSSSWSDNHRQNSTRSSSSSSLSGSANRSNNNKHRSSDDRSKRSYFSRDRSSYNNKQNVKRARFDSQSNSYHDYVDDSRDDTDEHDDETTTNNNESSTALNDEIKYQEASYIQTTLISIYYNKNENNAKLINASGKLRELCDKFNQNLMKRSENVRKTNNSDEYKVPNYRQLLQTKHFSRFSTCTCDHSSSSFDKKEHKSHCHKVKKTKPKAHCDSSCDEDEEESSSSSSSCVSSESSSSDSSCSSSSSDEEGGSDGEKSAKKKNKKEENDNDFNEFDDIRSMELDRKMKHPERLHKDLSFNEPDQTNEGPLCKCKLKNTTFGTRHQIYYGEQRIEPCDGNSNNASRLFHYRMTITPYTNFIHKVPTFIEYDKHEYLFEGFSIFSHEPLGEIPDCVVVIYNHEYKLNFTPEDMIDNFTINELELIKSYLFEEILELYDLKWKGYGVVDGCNRFHIMPRFCRELPYNGKELLSPCEILKYFMQKSVPVVSNSLLSKIRYMSDNEWQDYVETLQGTLVTYPGKRPSSIRLDQLDRDELMRSSSKDNYTYPLIIHFNMFRNTWLPMIKNDLKLKKLYHKYFKLRHLLNNKSKLTSEDKAKLRNLGDELQKMIKKANDVHKEIMIELSSEHFYCTGIRTDIVQQAILIPTFVEHVRFHLSLKYLEEKIGYSFKNRLLLQYALTHPSGAFLLHQNLGSNPDHIRNTLYNCRARSANYGDLTPQKRKSLLRKKGIHMLFSIMAQKAHDFEESSCISNYERLEFLGDKILELLTSKHLFFLFPSFDEGQLSEYRNALVQNQYLAVLAKKLDMHYFIIFYHGVDLCSNSALNHALANSFEALLAAVFLDSDLETVSKMLCRIFWDEDDLRSVWANIPLHPLQAQYENTDRHMISSTKILQQVSKFEEMIGIEFNHIRLLAQAFCTRSASFNFVTLGDNQRLEFLGDTVLNFVVSDYLYRYFPKHHEGHLSLLRSSLVCNSTQALLYDELGMADFVLTSYISNRTENNGNLKRKADVFEAFVGALYIDQGLEAVGVFCNVCMFNKLQDIILYQFWNDPKSRLQQCCLSLRDVDDSKPALPTYKLIEEKGPPNRKQYKVAVYFNRSRIGEGIGKSIHEAEVEAAKNALKTKSNMFPILNKYVAHETKGEEKVVEDKQPPKPATQTTTDASKPTDTTNTPTSNSNKPSNDSVKPKDDLEEGECSDEESSSRKTESKNRNNREYSLSYNKGDSSSSRRYSNNNNNNNNDYNKSSSRYRNDYESNRGYHRSYSCNDYRSNSSSLRNSKSSSQFNNQPPYHQQQSQQPFPSSSQQYRNNSQQQYPNNYLRHAKTYHNFNTNQQQQLQPHPVPPPQQLSGYYAQYSYPPQKFPPPPLPPPQSQYTPHSTSMQK